MTFNEYVKIVEQSMIQTNLFKLRKEIKENWIKKKINNWIDKYGYEYDEVENKILTDEMFAMFFIKNPIKQNYIAKLADELLCLKRLPAGALAFDCCGNICKGTNINNSTSIDYIRGNEYILQKYTTGSGGTQDSQYKQIIQFLEYGSKKNKVVAYLDGSYYNEDRISKLKKHFDYNKNVIITSLGELFNERFKENPTLYH